MNKYLSMTEIGRLYGVSSHAIGRWLKSLGLRTADGSPSRAAFDGEYVSERPSTNPNTYYYDWDAEKTTKLLDQMEYPRSGKSPPGN